MDKSVFMNKIKNCNKRFLLIPLIIEFYKTGNMHANMIIVDNLKKTIEKFEPNNNAIRRNHGKQFLLNLDNQLKKLFPNYKFNLLSDFTPFEMMVQDIEEMHLKMKIKTPRQKEDAFGYCADWSIWYSEMKLKYPNLDREKLITKSIDLLVKNKHSLRTFIRSYSFQIMKFRNNLLKKNIVLIIVKHYNIKHK